MHRTRDTRRHPARTKQRKRANAAQKADAARTLNHPLFGEIPLLPKPWTDAEGNEHTEYTYDLSYEPPLPKGAVRGNVHRQCFCTMCHVPRYFYVDVEQRCVQCDRLFVFSGSEQKYWYETLQFHFDSVATRCVSCRRKRRSDKALQQQLVHASAQAEEHPENAAAQLALGEAIVRLFERRREGSLSRAIAACRKARRLCGKRPLSEVAEATYWEARAHAFAGRVAAARELFQQVLTAGTLRGRKAALLEETKRWLGEQIDSG